MNGCTPTGAQPYAEDNDEKMNRILPALESHLPRAFSGCFCSFVRSIYLPFFLLCVSVERSTARNQASTPQTKQDRLAFEETKSDGAQRPVCDPYDLVSAFVVKSLIILSK